MRFFHSIGLTSVIGSGSNGKPDVDHGEHLQTAGGSRQEGGFWSFLPSSGCRAGPQLAWRWVYAGCHASYGQFRKAAYPGGKREV